MVGVVGSSPIAPTNLLLNIKLPDGSVKTFPGPVTAAEIAASIGAGLARAALAAKVDGKLVDTSFRVESDAEVAIVTERDREGVEILRHSTAHLLAHAVKELFPEAQVTIGPVIENGFYYDFAFSRPFTPEDLAAIEGRMAEIVKRDLPVVRKEMPRDAAVKFFRDQGEVYKAEIIAAIPQQEPISLYAQGNFTDLCRGPHVPSTGKLKVFKLMSVAGAYWRGDSKNEMLQRIYGTAWAKKEDQDAYLKMLEEAEKRDHRKLGTQLDLFHFQDEAPGAVFWHPKGWTLFLKLVEYMRAKHLRAGFLEVNAPEVMDRKLWEKSGHWDNYREMMYTSKTEDGRVFVIKPMNCPGHVQIFAQGVRSYRELPLRYAEFGKVHRYEPSGALHGLMRVRAFTQDDSHLFCTEEQMQDEVRFAAGFIFDIYKHFGFSDVAVKLSDRPKARIGSDTLWDRLEAALHGALKAMGVAYTVNKGDGAFYGPKLDFILRDAIGRDWQCGTVQVDLNLPERFDISYVASDNTRKRPVMLHVAKFGSLERFTGILLEHYAGALPVSLAPVQAAVLSITEAQADYARAVARRLREAGFRIVQDLRNEKISYKIREHSLQKLPYQLIVGAKEVQAGTVAVRTRGGEDLGALTLEDFIARLRNEAGA
jgi:threonyl-tRNA synthetase